uniref:Oxidation resistance protein 1 n=1 Tax=Blastobotrys adeninivorans TaxID=409370 RepID=A0A060T275_BLAAD
MSALRDAFQSLRRASSFGGTEQTPKHPHPTKVPTEPLQSSNFDIPPLEPIQLVGYAPQTKTRLMTESLAEEVRQLVPARLQLYPTWRLVYSLEQSGASLSTLYSKISDQTTTSGRRPGYVLLVRDSYGCIFGAYANEGFKPTDSRRFSGNGESFLWKTTVVDQDTNNVRFQAFPYTGLNDFVMFCTKQFISMGGGDGHYGLWIDSDLDKGVSQPSLTFGNETLAHNAKFSIMALEVWRVG